MSKFCNKNTLDDEEIWKVFRRSTTFGWSWCKKTDEPFRHTAIVLYFDDVPWFIINFRPADGENKASAACGGARPLITIEYMGFDSPVEYYPALEKFLLPEDFDLAVNRIGSIISYEPENYNLFTNNCRDHVEGVVKDAFRTEIPDRKFAKDMAKIRNGDTVRIVAAVFIAFATIIVVLLAVFRSTKPEKIRGLFEKRVTFFPLASGV